MKRNIFIIDKGHRQDTPGKRANGLLEWEFNEDVGNRLAKLLRPIGEVYFTIDTLNHPYDEKTKEGRTKNLEHRCTVANKIYYEAIKKYEDDFNIVFISIHANAHSNPEVSGYEVYVYRYNTIAHEIAKRIMNVAREVLGVEKEIKNRGIKEKEFYVLANTKMPAVLVEHEFYTNLEAVNKLKDDNFREKCALHLAKGLYDYIGIKHEDISPWSVEARNWAIKNGISDGTRPKDAATREEVWTMLYRMVKGGK